MPVKIRVKYAKNYTRAERLFFNTRKRGDNMPKEKPKPDNLTQIVHPPVRPAPRKGSRVTGVLK
jgi:hypothetical protein